MKQFELPYFGRIEIEKITEGLRYLNFQNRKIIIMWFAEDIDEKY